MSFLGATFLLALPLVAVPVAIHLYRGRQRDVVMWGAMQFLAAAVTKGRRMERLEELLLMAVRFAAVAVLILALAQPMVRGSWLRQATDHEVILVLDNSLSMSRELDGESASECMKREALDAIDSLTGGDGVQIMLAVGSEWATAEAIPADGNGKRRLREIVEAAEPTQGAANLLTCLQAAVHLEAAEGLSSRRVLVFTDSQANSWQIESQRAWQQLAADRDAARFPIAVAVIECDSGASRLENLAVAAVQADRSLVQPDDQLQVTAEIINTGNEPSDSATLEWLVAGKPVQESPLAPLEPHAKRQATTSLRMAEAGVFAVTCRIKNRDQLPLDQENSLVVEVANELPILFVEGGAASDPAVASPRLFAAALGFNNGKPQVWHSIFRPETTTLAALAAQPLEEFRAILIDDVGAVDRETLDRLDAFVRAGGGLWITLGDETDRETFNRDWYRDGDGLSPLLIESLEVLEGTNDMDAAVHPPSRDHPATLQLANTTQLDIDEARVAQRWRFAERSAAGGATSLLLESGNGHPLVAEKFVGQGRVLVQAFPLDLDWSNLPLLKAYVVMVHDWLAYITAPRTARYNLSPGATLVATAPNESAAASAMLLTPRGTELPLIATDADFAPVYRYSQTRLPGLYRVRFATGEPGGVDVPFHVARDSSESDLRPLAEADRAGLSRIAGLGWAGAAPPSSQMAKTAPRLDPAWGVLLMLLVALLAGEMLLSIWLSRGRQGLAVSTV